MNTVTKHTRFIKCKAVLVSDKYRDLPRPSDEGLKGREEILPVYEGQIIQVSKNPGGQWMYGTIPSNPLKDHQDNVLIAKVLSNRPTAGWFPQKAVKAAKAKQN